MRKQRVGKSGAYRTGSVDRCGKATPLPPKYSILYSHILFKSATPPAPSPRNLMFRNKKYRRERRRGTKRARKKFPIAGSYM